MQILGDSVWSLGSKEWNQVMWLCVSILQEQQYRFLVRVQLGEEMHLIFSFAIFHA